MSEEVRLTQEEVIARVRDAFEQANTELVPKFVTMTEKAIDSAVTARDEDGEPIQIHWPTLNEAVAQAVGVCSLALSMLVIERAFKDR